MAHRNPVNGTNGPGCARFFPVPLIAAEFLDRGPAGQAVHIGAKRPISPLEARVRG